MAKFPYKRILAFTIPFIGFLLYANTFQHQYALDDIPIVRENSLIKKGADISALFKTHYWAGKPNANDKGLYRPFTLASYAIQYQVSGDRPEPFHWTNALLHGIVCLLILLTIKLLFGSEFIGLVSAGLFAVHPIHTEAVAGIVGRAELLSLLFILLSIYLFFSSFYQNSWKKWLLLFSVLVTSAAAALSKELGFLIPLFILLSFLLEARKKRAINRIIPQTGTFIGVLILMIILWMVRANITSDTVTHELWRGVSSTERIATSLRTCLEYVGMLVFPIKLSADYWSTEVPLIGLNKPIVYVSIIVIIASVIFALKLRKRVPAFTWGIFFFGISLFPVSNIPFAIGVLKAERILYAPSLGFIVALASLLYLIYQHKKYRSFLYILIAVYSMVLATKTWMRNPVWKNNFTLSRATVLTSPDSPRMNNLLGQAYKKQKKPDQALYYLERAVASRPEHLPAVVNLALMKKKTGDLQGAILLLEQGLRYHKNHFEAGVNLIGLYRSAGQLQAGRKLGNRLLKVYPRSAAIMTNLGNIYYDLGQTQKAQNLWDKAKGKK